VRTQNLLPVAGLTNFDYIPCMTPAKKMTDMDEIMTLEEVATYLKVTPRTIYRMLEEEQIPAFKVRGAWRFRKDEIQKMTRGALPEKGGK
jgi:excisionase family DNA binding protein